MLAAAAGWLVRSWGTGPQDWLVLSPQFGGLVGGVYGLVAGAGFVATAIRVTAIRWAVCVGVCALGVGTLTAVQTRVLGLPPEPRRYLLFLGGLLVAQPWAARIAGIPRWNAAERRPLPRGQYRLSDWMLSMTVLAMLFAVAVRYRPPVEGTLFWFVLFSCWFGLPLLATLAYAAGLRRSIASACLFGAFTAAGALLGTAGLVAAEAAVARRMGSGPIDASWLWAIYGPLVASFCLVALMLGLLGRRDRQAKDVAPGVDRLAEPAASSG